MTGSPEQVDLRPLLRPSRVAVAGASEREGRPNTAMWRRLVAWGRSVGADVVPVNPGADEVDGIPAHPTVSSVVAGRGPVDLVAVLVGDPLPVVEDAAASGAEVAVVFASGFGELGPEGAARQQALVDAARGTKLRILGPNTNLNMFDPLRDDLAGPSIALLTQSGHQGRPLYMAQELGVRLAGWIPTGNEADLEVADGIEWFSGQPDVGAVALYAEGFKDGDRLRAALDHAADRRVPVVALKVGRSRAGQAAARTHTGKLAGGDRVVDAVLRQHGATRVDDLDELLDCSVLLARSPRPPRVAGGGAVVYSISGGTGAHAADVLSAAGVGLAPLSAELQTRLHELIPADLSVRNPVDTGGHPVGDERGRRLLELLVGSPEVGALVVPITGPFPPLSDVLARDLVAVAEQAEIPICVVWGSPLGDETAYRDVLSGSSRLVVCRRLSNAARALRAWVDWHDHLARRARRPEDPTGSADDVERVRHALEGHAVLGEHDAKQLLATFGVPVTHEVVVRDESAAVRAATELAPGGRDGPVVVKATGEGMLHKTEVGGVRVGVTGPDEVRRAYRDMAALSPEGVLVSEQVNGGVEAVVGITTDAVFGPVVVIGAGGVLAELTDDVATLVPPFTRDDVELALRHLVLDRVLEGARGRGAADRQALVDAAMAVQALAVAGRGVLRELDVNPLIVRAAGEGVVALDALAVPL